MKTVTELTKSDIKPLTLSEDCRDHVGETFVFHTIKERESAHGMMIFASVSSTEEGEKSEMFMRGEKVQERLKFLERTNGFPCKGTIVKKGRAWDLE